MSIIVRIQGGTGNQLFQYAFGLALSKRLGTRLFIDTTTYEDPKYNPHKIHRPFALNNFNTKFNLAKDSNLFGFVWLRKHHKLFDAFYKFLRLKSIFLFFYYPEQTFAFDPNVYHRRYKYFDGDWTTWRYFENIADEICEEFKLAKPLSEYGRNIEGQIKQTNNSVSLHVRRGDYVSDPVAVVYHGICSMEYYRSAIEIIEKNTVSPHYFIFSDDYNWALENFKFLKNYTCVKNDNKDYEDLALISECNHHIIANSTFGWWGAWLDPKKDKIVIAPKKWFAQAPKGNLKDLFPTNWITI